MCEARYEHSTVNIKPGQWLGMLCVLLGFACAPAYAGTAPGIAVKGNQLVTTTAGTLGDQNVAANTPVVLRGINITGSEYECLAGDSVWDSSSLPSSESTTDYQTVINGILSWHANVVRIPLNEDCWLDVPSSNKPPAATSGANYSGPIGQFVQLATQSGLIVEVDLHVGGGPYLAKNGNNVDSFPAMDTNYSQTFWVSVANYFKSNPSVIFNLTNEPEFSSDSSWSCYLNGGCSTKGLPNSRSKNGGSYYWTVQGTQSVVTAIRNTGATNPIIIAGINYSNQLDEWLSYVPTDPLKQIIAGVHIYFDGIACENSTCWTTQFGAIQTAGYPVVVDETGEFDCTGKSETTLTTWADAQSPQIGYWFWAFTNQSGCNEPALLSNNQTFAPSTGYGAFAMQHLQSIQ